MDSTLKTKERKRTEDEREIDEIKNSHIKSIVLEIRAKEKKRTNKILAERRVNEIVAILETRTLCDHLLLSTLDEFDRNFWITGKSLPEMLDEKELKLFKKLEEIRSALIKEKREAEKKQKMADHLCRAGW